MKNNFQSSTKITEKQLGVVKEMNTMSKSGEINTTDVEKVVKIKQFLAINAASGIFDIDGVVDKYNIYTFSLISTLLNWHQSKFEWDGFDDDITGEELERILFMWGRAALVKVGDKFYALNFASKKWDLYQRPTHIQPIRPDGKIMPTLKVGKDAVILWNDKSYLFSQQPLLGTLFRIWPFIKKLTLVWTLLNRNLHITKQFITVPIDTSEANVEKINKTVLSNTKYVIKLSQNIMSTITTGTSDNKLTFDDKTNELWENYYNYFNELKLFLGIESNSNSKKKERQISAEISVNNEIPNSQLEIQLRMREKAAKQINETFGKSVSIKLNEREDDQLNGLNEDKNND